MTEILPRLDLQTIIISVFLIGFLLFMLTTFIQDKITSRKHSKRNNNSYRSNFNKSSRSNDYHDDDDFCDNDNKKSSGLFGFIGGASVFSSSDSDYSENNSSHSSYDSCSSSWDDD